jgi:membrane-associated phospholipid phosphatase
MSGNSNYQGSHLPLILGGVVALFFLNMNSAIHTVLIHWDTNVAIAANSLLAINPTFDRILGWINTRVGDGVVLTIMASTFIGHSLSASTFEEVVERLSFWAWVAVLCISTYILVCLTAHFYFHPIPLEALQQLHDVRTVYQIPLRSSTLNSYPSGHGLAYLFFALMAWCKRYNRMSLFILALGTIMLSMRVILGMHWMSDIFLGALPLALVLSSAANYTPLKRSYEPFYSFTYFMLAKLSGQPWLFEQLAASQHRERYQLPSWAHPTNGDSLPASKPRVLEASMSRGRHS